MTVPAPTRAQLGILQTADGRSYQLTPNDALWLARAVRFEGGNPAATAWTYAWRFFTKNWRGTLAELVRAHSQTINPAWDSASDPLCVAHPQYCSSETLERRIQNASTPWSALGNTTDLIVDWAQAKVPNPAPKADNFADAAVSAGFLVRNPRAKVVLQQGNWYIAENPALSSNFVTVKYGEREIGAGTSDLLELAVVVGIGAFAAWRFYRPVRAIWNAATPKRKK